MGDCIVIGFLASIVLCFAQTCNYEITRHIDVRVDEASFASTVDLPQSPTNCLSSIVWNITTTDRSSQWISIEILDFAIPPSASRPFDLYFALSNGDEWSSLEQDLQRRLYVEVNKEPLLRLDYMGSNQELSDESYRFQARLTLTNDTDCGENFFCDGICLHSKVICDGQLQCDANDETNCDHCGGMSTINVTDDKPYVLAMNYESDEINFPFGRNCFWYVSASMGYRIKVTFIEYSTKERNSLYFGDGKIFQENALAATTRGRYSRLFITSESSDMWITFVSEESSDDRFTLQIEQFEPVECRPNEYEFTCPSGLACIPVDQVCDGIPHCPLQGDEYGCGLCEADSYVCPDDGSCVDGYQGICNGYADCSGLMDERNCYPCGVSDLLLNNTTAPSVTLTSVDFPHPYPNNILCVWFITANTDSIIAFNFSVLNLEQNYDTLTIGNGHIPSDQSSVIVQLSGALTNVQVFTKGHKAWVIFKTDNYVKRSGFSVRIMQESTAGSCAPGLFACQDQSAGLTCMGTDAVCDGFELCPDGSDEPDEQLCDQCGDQVIYIYTDPVILNSPGYPGPYPNDARCTWQISGKLQNPVYMRILDFDLEHNFDFLIVSLNGVPSDPLSEELFRLTGYDISRKTLAWASDVFIWLTFKTDSTVASRGFSIIIAHVDNITDISELGAAICLDDEFYCGDGMCISQNATCNGYLDCLNYKDETDCNDVFCPGSYKCDNFNTNTNSTSVPPIPDTTSFQFGNDSISPLDHSSSDYSSSDYSSSSLDHPSNPDLPQAQCIPRAQVCNGEMDCPDADDETECDIKRCPDGCQCSYSSQDLKVSCPNGWDSRTLSDLALTTHTLQLSGVNISMLDRGIFKVMSHLRVLSLRDNMISEIQQRTFDGLENLLWLDLSNTSLKELKGSALEELSSLRGITIFDVPLTRIKKDAFLGLGRMKTLIIVRNIKGLPPLEIEENAFRGLEGVSELYVDDHRLCCFFPSTTECKTLEPEPPLFMCSELMPNVVLKVFMWTLGISALVGNLFVMVWRCREKTEGRASRIVHSFLVFNLAVSDALMGLYMLIIAGADANFGKQYFEVSNEWRTSILCQSAGFISIIASEASVFFLTLISIDRFLSIVFPFSRYHLRPKPARVVTICIWIGTVIVALVPTILASDVTSDVYGLSDVCIGLPLMTKVTEYMTVEQMIEAEGVANITVGIPFPVDTRASWFFSIALFLGVNLLCFTVILVCYIAIFAKVRTSVKRVRRHKKRDDEVRLAIKMAVIVMTDFICWVPIIVMGILSQARVVEIPTETYAWIVVFILPINSALNPYLYTISDLCSQQRRATAMKKNSMAMKNSNSGNRVSTIATIRTDIDSSKINDS